MALLLTAAPMAAQSYGIVLRVNERIATTFDYYRKRAEKASAIQAAESLSPERRQRLLAELGVSTMSDLFEELLMLSRADQLGLDVSETEIDRAVERSKLNFGIETEEQFEQALLASNLTVEQFRRNMRRTLLVQRLMAEEIQPRITLEEEDLRRYYQSHEEDFRQPERLDLREVVLLESSGLVEEDLGLLAEEIRQQLLSGRDLEEVAKPYAERGVSSNAVDLGWVEPGDLDRDLEEVVWGLGPGEVSEPVAGRGGLHVLVVVGREEAKLQSFAEVEQQIRAIEGERLFNDESRKYLEELESRAYVIANPPPEAAGFQASLRSSKGDDELARALTAPLIAEPSEPPASPEGSESDGPRDDDSELEIDPDAPLESDPSDPPA